MESSNHTATALESSFLLSFSALEKGDGYRYGYNGMEKDDEVKGGGNSYDFGARMYDPRVARWLSVDALEKKYPSLSPYNFVGNRPIISIDPDGKRIIIIVKTYENSTAVLKQVEYKNGKLYTVDNGEIYNPSEGSYALKVMEHLNQLENDDPILAERINDLVESKESHFVMKGPRKNYPNRNAGGPIPLGSNDKKHDEAYIQNKKEREQAEKNIENGIPSGTHTYYDPDNWKSSIGKRHPRVALAHELLGHAWDADQGETNYGTVKIKNTKPLKMYEFEAVQIENLVRAALNIKLRGNYGPYEVPAKYKTREGIKSSKKAKLKDPGHYKF